MKTIGASFSGGGFRATAFTMGCLDYLNGVKLGERTLLSNIVFSSSTSGGSIAMGLHAALSHQGKTFPEILAFAREKMQGDVLLSQAMAILQNDVVWADYPTKNRNLINSFAIAYDRELFSGATLRLFTDVKKPTAISGYCFNTTELNNGGSFRFLLDRDPKQVAYIGNFWQHEAPHKRPLFERVRLADVVAASSCFPGGFEPMVYPDDYEEATPIGLKDALVDEHDTPLAGDRLPLGLLDGGAVDNQGLGALEQEAHRRAVRKEPFDLLISCDVSSFRMDRYSPPDGRVSWRKGIRIGQVKWVALFIGASLLTAFVVALVLRSWVVVAALVSPTALAVWACAKAACFFREGDGKGAWGFVLKKYGMPTIKQLRFKPARFFLQARTGSLGLLVNSVFMNQIRRQHYGSVYDGANKLAVISCFVYELATVNTANLARSMMKKRAKAEAAGRAHLWDAAVSVLQPSPALCKVADRAASMDTTLWFDPTNAHKLDDLIVCGHFTMCYNLLVHLAESEAVHGSLNSEQEQLRAKLLADWKLYTVDPYSRLKEYFPTIDASPHS